MAGTLTSVVVPTVGRPSLRVLLEALASGTRPLEVPVVVVDDRREGAKLVTQLADIELPSLRVVRSGGGGPARARNIGWRHTATPWVSFLDDDVLPDPEWFERLQHDLDTAATGVAGSQGQVRIPLPADRRPTDWERGTAGLATALWITADMSYRRSTSGFLEPSARTPTSGCGSRPPRARSSAAPVGSATRSAPRTTGRAFVSRPATPTTS
jgi:glycosyltransferase involved in cell wall biosynthesis